MRDAEEAAFARGVCAAKLMDEAGAGIARVITQFFPRAGHAVLYLGKGNNAGDALVAARHLLDAGWTLWARPTFMADEFKELPGRHWKSLAGKIITLDSPDQIAQLKGTVVLLDGLVGIGATGPLRGALADAVIEMNQLCHTRHAVTVALDLPSGLDSGGVCVQADCTITIGHVKDLLLTDQATDFVGRLAIVPLRELSVASGDNTRNVLTPQILLPKLPRRTFDFHKGEAGRVGIIAGSRGFLGAAVLCATGALRGGAGLVTLFVKDEFYPMIAALAPPEIMVQCVKNYREVLQIKLDALAIGPGLGSANEEEVLKVIADATVPAVIDADALNMLARRGLGEMKTIAASRLLTPHPGEMARLIEREPEWQNLERGELAAAFVKKFPQFTLLLKGARTVVASHGHPLSFNTSGHPGMASGGMGDVLTGLCAALAGQGVALHDAACLGAWLSGRAAEIAVQDGAQSQESLTAGDVAAQIGAAYADLRALVF
ncbi:MAG: NAD(P)H-hydrate dehydratase [Verrucomicrobia bacterium]|nr:NAD(P)H-hydrate dehydratase [Verrucomicrobiota bacterium]